MAGDSTQTLLLPPVSEAATLLANPGLAIARALATVQEREAGGGDARDSAAQESPPETPWGDVPPAQPAETATSESQPTATPGVPPAASSIGSGNPPPPAISTPEGFIDAVALGARDSQQQTGVPASVTIAQAILESNWGKSVLSLKAQNYFGIKAISGPGPAGVIAMDTREVLGGQNVTMRDGFKAYHNLYESVMDHGRFLADNPRYANAFKTTDPKEFAQRIHDAGYATDPYYCNKVNILIDTYRLDKYDVR